MIRRAVSLAWEVSRGAATLGVRLAFRRAADRRDVIVATALVGVAERLGPTYIKLGQILSTRRDLFGDAVIAVLARLRDRTAAVPLATVRQMFRDEFAIDLDAAFGEFDPTPVASGSIATVFRACLPDGRRVAVKVRRPGIAGVIDDDLRLLRTICRLVSRLPFLRVVPVEQTVEQLAACLRRQVDFRLEADANRRLQHAFVSSRGVVIPRLVDPLCGEAILTMDYISGLGDAPPDGGAAESLRVAVGALFRMIFVEGFVHCDMHDGNLYLLPGGRAALIDFGFMAEMTSQHRLKFAEFFYALAANDGSRCARITVDLAAYVPADLDYEAFAAEVESVVGRAAGARASDFQVARFVLSMFDIQRRFGIQGTTGFTMAIVALLVFEGIAKHVDPNLDFQREATPFLLRALATGSSAFRPSAAW